MLIIFFIFITKKGSFLLRKIFLITIQLKEQLNV